MGEGKLFVGGVTAPIHEETAVFARQVHLFIPTSRSTQDYWINRGWTTVANTVSFHIPQQIIIPRIDDLQEELSDWVIDLMDEGASVLANCMPFHPTHKVKRIIDRLDIIQVQPAYVPPYEGGKGSTTADMDLYINKYLGRWRG